MKSRLKKRIPNISPYLRKTLPLRVCVYLSMTIFGLWLFWDARLAEVLGWVKWDSPFPLPFGIFWIPLYSVYDLAILTCWLSSLFSCTELIYWALVYRGKNSARY